MMDRFSLRTLHWRRKFWAILEVLPPVFTLLGPPVNQKGSFKKKKKGIEKELGDLILFFY
jgi:hypothetical protein